MLQLAEAAHENGFHEKPEVQKLVRDTIARAYLNQRYQDAAVDKVSDADFDAFFEKHPELLKSQKEVKGVPSLPIPKDLAQKKYKPLAIGEKKQEVLNLSLIHI